MTTTRTFSDLQNTYETTLKEIGTLQKNLANKTAQYVSRVTQVNPYFNKTIKFSNNVFAHVTNKGVVKKYNMQPAITGVMPLTFPWLPAYDSPGVQIPTTPPLVTGTPMNGTSVGFEGENVFVNTVIPNADSIYKGCKVTNDSVKFIGGAPTSDVANGSYTYDACKQAATNDGYKYFGIQNADNKGTGFCAVTNEDPSNLAESRVNVPLTLQKWGRPAVGNYVVLNNKGQLVLNSPSSGWWNFNQTYITNALWDRTPDFIGCYGVNNNIKIDYFANTKEKCFRSAERSKFNYYGLQKSFMNGNSVQCALGNDLNEFKKTRVSKSGCRYNSRNTYVGDMTSTAVFTRNPNEKDNYYLLLMDSGRIGIYRGSDPLDYQNSTQVGGWSYAPGAPNPKFAAANSKFGKNYLMAGQTLAPGDFVGSPNGAFYFLMDTTGVLSLNATVNRISCTKLSNNTWVGGVGSNALYELASGPGFSGNVGKLGYVDENSTMWLYNAEEVKTTANDSYSVLNGLDTSSGDIVPAINASTPKDCQAKCNTNDNCSAAVFNTSTNNCNLKGSDFTNGIRSQTTSNLYVRNKQPGVELPGISNKINMVDSIKFNNYTTSGGNYSNPLSNANSVQRAALSNATDRANLLSNQLINGTTARTGTGTGTGTGTQRGSGSVKENYDNMKDNINGINKNISQESTTIHEKINDDFNEYQDRTKLRRNMKNNDNIVKDSNILVLQQNYTSMFWTVLATGAVLVSMAVVK